MIDENHSVAPAAPRQTDPPEAASPVLASVLLVLAALAVNVMVLAKVDVPVVRPALGFWFVIILPTFLLFTSSAWRKCGPLERLGYSLCSVLLALMLVGLVVNEVLPVVGVQRPLDVGSILIISDLMNVSLYVFRSRSPNKIRLGATFARISKQEFRLIVAAVLTVVLVIFGANHLNNGASAHITIIALVMMAVIGFFAIRWLDFTRESVICVVIYLVGLGLLLSTSLRGWYITGHDIQQEYLVFQLTESHAHWSMAYFRDPYNACLSITILPTELGQIINVDNPYVFKLFFQLIFAVCPVLAYGIARRFFNRGVSTLAVAYFVSFPIFYTDTPFLNRQEIALLFVAVGLFAATNPVWTVRRRQVALGVAGVGAEISHYSTMYVFVGTLAFALVLSYASRFFIKPEAPDPRATRPDASLLKDRRGRRRWIPTPKGALTIGVVIAFVGIVFAWGTLATKSTTAVLADSKSAIASGSISFSVLPGSNDAPPATIRNNLVAAGLDDRATAAAGTYLPWSAASTAPTPIVNPPLTPLTPIGRGLNSVGIPVATINTVAHSFEADGIELFLAVGLISLFIEGWRRGRIVGGAFYWLAAGCTCMIVLITVFPSISADYGVLRAFQQGLLFFSPMIVIGSMTIFKPLGRRRARTAACVVCLVVFLAATTLIPQILGNNNDLASLNLNNSGTYYDLYYKAPQDASAGTWLDEQPNLLRYPIQASWDDRKFFVTGPTVVNGTAVIGDEYPTLVDENSWVVLDHTTMSTGNAYSYDPTSGGVLEYKYPIGLLYKYKNLVYTDGGAEIYK